MHIYYVLFLSVYYPFSLLGFANWGRFAEHVNGIIYGDNLTALLLYPSICGLFWSGDCFLCSLHTIFIWPYGDWLSGLCAGL